MAAAAVLTKKTRVTLGGTIVDVTSFSTNAQRIVNTFTTMGSDGPCQVKSDKSAGDEVTLELKNQYDDDVLLALWGFYRGTDNQTLTITNDHTAAVGTKNPTISCTVAVSSFSPLGGAAGETSDNSLTCMVDGEISVLTS